MKLRIKQEKFCLEYAASGNATQSYIKAGYKIKNEEVAAAAAAQLLRNIKVKQRLRELADEQAQPKIANIQEAQEKLTSILRQQAEEEVVVVESCKARKVLKKASLLESIKAAELLIKMQGGLTRNVNVIGAVPVVISGSDELAE